VVVEHAASRTGIGGTGGAGTRRRILAVALELFAAQGYAGTSIRDITERMGLTKAALYYHFASKEQILDAVTEPLRADFAALGELAGQEPLPPPAEILGRLVDILSRRVALIRTMTADPSARLHHRPPEVQELLDRVAAALAPDGSALALVRARCALGAVQFGAFQTAQCSAAAQRILAGAEHLLSQEERAEIVSAGLRALEP
jgi:AcrR family transcriptional regulator